MIERLDAMFAGHSVPGRDRGVRRRLDSPRRLAVPQLAEPRALPGLPVRRGRAVRRRALPDAGRPRSSRADRQVLRRIRRDGGADDAARTCSARSPRMRETRCSSAATSPTSPSSPARCATTSMAPTRCSTSVSPMPTTSTTRVRQAVRDVRLRVRLLAGSRARPGEALLPFEHRDRPPHRRTCGSRGWQHDPVRMAPGHADALRGLRRIYLDAGKSDEYFLDLGAQAFARELDQLGVAVHAGIVRRPPRRHQLPLPGGDPRAHSRPRSPSRIAQRPAPAKLPPWRSAPKQI